MLVNSDGKGLLKKVRNMDILRRLITENKIQNTGPFKTKKKDKK